jgi:hypothetical protein
MMSIEKSRSMALDRAALKEETRPAKAGNNRAILPRIVPASLGGRLD